MKKLLPKSTHSLKSTFVFTNCYSSTSFIQTSTKLFFLFLIFIFNFGCKKKNLIIGDHYGGGIVIYVLVEGDPGYSKRHEHGLIVAESDLKDNTNLDFPWGCTGTKIPGVDDRVIGAGETNTKSFVKGCSQTNAAARLCSDLKLNSEDDWFLPSLNELDKLFVNWKLMPNIIRDPDETIFWSSTQYNESLAWAIDFNTGEKVKRSKEGYNYYVRPIRSF